nr:MAG TPA: hypothetical protein [Caudoviricetes sp.]
MNFIKRLFGGDDFSSISKTCIFMAAIDLMIAFYRISQENYAGAVFDFVLVGFMLYEAWWYRDY